ncbi:MAG: hypothetical protein C0511_06535 [Hyphomicrobium sp.]|nr:hypothetical protein [Hyphomicrobium sp.]
MEFAKSDDALPLSDRCRDKVFAHRKGRGSGSRDGEGRTKTAPAGAEEDLLNTLPHLLHRASQGADWLVDRRLAEFNLTNRQFSVLEDIDRNVGQSQIKLVARTGIDRSTLVNILDRLQGRGLVTRRRSGHDRRAVVLKLTEHGKDVLAKARPIVSTVNRDLIARLPEEHRDALLAFLEHAGSSRG